MSLHAWVSVILWARLQTKPYTLIASNAMQAVRAIGRCAVSLERAAERCINVLLELIQTKLNYVVQEAIIVIKDIFRRYPNKWVQHTVLCPRHLSCSADRPANMTVPACTCCMPAWEHSDQQQLGAEQWEAAPRAGSAHRCIVSHWHDPLHSMPFAACACSPYVVILHWHDLA